MRIRKSTPDLLHRYAEESILMRITSSRHGPNEEDETMPNCPECDAQFELSAPEKAEIVSCPECGAELEVVDVEPLCLALAPIEEEDWGE